MRDLVVRAAAAVGVVTLLALVWVLLALLITLSWSQ
jgi:hypothetical protein